MSWAAFGAIAAINVAVAVRFGWLAALVAMFAGGVINIMPLTFAPHDWYARANAAAAAALVGLAGYGLVVSVGRQRLLPADL